jgi:hypothetical protein
MTEIKNFIRRGLTESLRKFEESKYHSVLISYYHLEVTYKECNPLIDEIQNFNKANIVFIIKSTIEETFKKNGMDKVKYRYLPLFNRS